MKKEINIIAEDSFECLCQNSITLIKNAKLTAVKQIDQIQILTYFILGKWIVEEQQSGKDRAGYGSRVIEKLSDSLTKEFGKGYSSETLKNIRKFYLTYQNRISKPVVSLLENKKSKPAVTQFDGDMPFCLSWTHYLILMRIEDEDERNFYEQQAYKEGWSKRELSRQYSSSLYERLLISKDKDKVKQLSTKGQIIETPSDMVKDPYVLEFLGLSENSEYSESDLEGYIIDHLQEFLLELGSGFTFVARQKRFSFNEDHFRVDLVFYNRLLQCFVLFDLKTKKLKHQDLGQMQMYVNYYDRYEKQDFENPTVGILLCPDKDDEMVELTLPKDSNIYAAKYELILPDKKLLQDKLKQWISEAEDMK